MKISLRKANAIQLLINEQINTPFVGAVSINKFDDPLVVVEQAGAEFIDTLNKKFDLIEVLYKIRSQVAVVGQVAGVADLLTQQAFLSKKEAFLKQLAGTTKYAPTKEQLDAQLADLHLFPTEILMDNWEIS